MDISESLSHVKAMRLADLADAARRLGRTEQADRFLLLAWAAYDELDPVDHQDTGTGAERVAPEMDATPGAVCASVRIESTAA